MKKKKSSDKEKTWCSLRKEQHRDKENEETGTNITREIQTHTQIYEQFTRELIANY